jgi:hypothetical protein
VLGAILLPRPSHVLFAVVVVAGVASSHALLASTGAPQLSALSLSIAFLGPTLSCPVLFASSALLRPFGVRFFWWLLLALAIYLFAAGFSGVMLAQLLHAPVRNALYLLVMSCGMLLGLYLSYLVLRTVGMAPNYSLKRTAVGRLQ